MNIYFKVLLFAIVILICFKPSDYSIRKKFQDKIYDELIEKNKSKSISNIGEGLIKTIIWNSIDKSLEIRDFFGFKILELHTTNDSASENNLLFGYAVLGYVHIGEINWDEIMDSTVNKTSNQNTNESDIKMAADTSKFGSNEVIASKQTIDTTNYKDYSGTYYDLNNNTGIETTLIIKKTSFSAKSINKNTSEIIDTCSGRLIENRFLIDQNGKNRGAVSDYWHGKVGAFWANIKIGGASVICLNK